GHPEGDLAAETARAGHRLVDDGGAVGGAHEEEVVAGGPQVRHPELDAAAVHADLAWHEEPVARDVDKPPQRAGDGAGVVDAVHQHQEGVEAELRLPHHATHSRHRTAHPGTAIAE